MLAHVITVILKCGRVRVRDITMETRLEKCGVRRTPPEVVGFEDVGRGHEPRNVGRL